MPDDRVEKTLLYVNEEIKSPIDAFKAKHSVLNTTQVLFIGLHQTLKHKYK